MKDDKAPGPGDVYAELIKLLEGRHLEFILDLFNDI